MCICKYCNKEFDSLQKLGGHIIKCKLNPKYNEILEKWKKSFINSTHENNKGFNYINKEYVLYCQYCGKECKSLNSLKNHERLCKENSNKQESSWVQYNKIREPNNQFIKAKKEGRIIIVSNETKEKFAKIWKGKSLPNEMKEKI